MSELTPFIHCRHRYIGQFSLLTPDKCAASAFIAMVAPDLRGPTQANQHIKDAKVSARVWMNGMHITLRIGKQLQWLLGWFTYLIAALFGHRI